MNLPKSDSDSCFAVIFTSRRTDVDPHGYEQTARRMVALAREQPGFLGIESARGEEGIGITVSYWDSEESIRRWQQHPEHEAAQRLGRERWYEWFELRVCRVMRQRRYGPVSASDPE